MANSKISALTSATTPLAGTETLPIVQSSTTKQVSVANLTSGRVVGLKSVSLDTVGSAIPSGGGMVRLSNGFTYIAGSSTGNGTIVTNGDGTATVRAISPGGSTGAVEIETGAGALAATFTAAGNLAFVNGKGIDFSATAGTGTSELLADYEEGTFTPTMTIGGTAVVSYYAQAGLYTKVGNVVNFYVRISGNNLGAGVGNIAILGLPFTTNATLSTVIYSLNDQANTNAYAFAAGSSTTISTGYTNATYLSGYALVFSGSYRV